MGRSELIGLNGLQGSSELDIRQIASHHNSARSLSWVGRSNLGAPFASDFTEFAEACRSHYVTECYRKAGTPSRLWI